MPKRSTRRTPRGLMRAGFVVAVAGVLGLVFLAGILLSPGYALPQEARVLVRDLVKKQLAVEEQLQAYIEASAYPLVDPLVIQNPYGTAPLTALAVFDTPQKSQISVFIPGDTPQADVNFTFAGYDTHHQIPIFGLYAGRSNPVTISAQTQNGETAQAVLHLETEPLPVYLEEIKLLSSAPERYSPGFNFTFLNHKMVFDINGQVRWYSTEETFQVYTRLANGHFLITQLMLDQNNTVLLEQDLLGRTYAIYDVPENVHHDAIELPNGNLLLTTGDHTAATIEDTLMELDRKTGRIVHYFDMKDYLDEDRPREIGVAPKDWLHLNSLFYDPVDQSLIISSRSQSAVIKFSYPRMDLRWILGPHDNWTEEYQPYLLQPQSEELQWPWSQHHASVYGVNQPGDGVLDVILFDNGLHRSFSEDSYYSPSESYSRAVIYHIDETNRRVEQVWQYGKERGSEILSASRGSAYELENGNILGTWAEITKDLQGMPVAIPQYQDETYETRLIEIDPDSGKVVFEVSFPGAKNYRTFRDGLYSEDGSLYASLPTRLNDRSPNDLSDRFFLFRRDLGKMQTDQEWVVPLKRAVRRLLSIF